MFYKIGNYLINVEDIRDLSLWRKNEGDDIYFSFSRDKKFEVNDDDEWFCIVVEFKHKTSDDDYAEIRLHVKNSEEAYRYFDDVVNNLFSLTYKENIHNETTFQETNKQDSTFCVKQENSLFN